MSFPDLTSGRHTLSPTLLAMVLLAGSGSLIGCYSEQLAKEQEQQRKAEAASLAQARKAAAREDAERERKEKDRATSRAIPVRPEWREFALSRYKEAVKRQLRAPATAQFEKEPSLGVTYHPVGNYLSMTALGEVDAQNGFGALLRTTYLIEWKEPGNPETTDNIWLDENTFVSNVR